MQLLDAENGKIVRVTGFAVGSGLEDKLRKLGLMAGDCARVVRQAPYGGPLLIEVGERAIAFGRNIAAMITVEEVYGCP